MRPFAINDIFLKHNGDVKDWVIKYIALPFFVIGLLTGCASTRQIAPITAASRAHVVGTAAVVESVTVIKYDINGKIVGREVTVRSSIKNAPAVDLEHQNDERRVRRDVGVEQAGSKLMQKLLTCMSIEGCYSGGQYYSQGQQYYQMGSRPSGRNVHVRSP